MSIYCAASQRRVSWRDTVICCRTNVMTGLNFTGENLEKELDWGHKVATTMLFEK